MAAKASRRHGSARGVPTAALTMVRWPRLGVTRGHHGFGGPHRRHSLEKGASRDDFPARSACGESFCSEGRRACRGRQFCRCDRRQTPAWRVDDVGTGLRRTGRLIPRILALDRRVGRHRARNLWVGRIVGIGPGPRLVVRRKVCRHLRHPGAGRIRPYRRGQRLDPGNGAGHQVGHLASETLRFSGRVAVPHVSAPASI